MTAAVLSLEERRTTYRTPEGEERPTFTGTPDWLYAYMPRLKQGCGWELLSLILHHQRMGLRTAPIAISLTRFQRETGRAIRTIQKGLSDLARAGLLYEELETPGRQDSAIRYAILSQEQVGQTPALQADGRLVVHLLDGPYEGDPTRLITRTGVGDAPTFPEHRKNGTGVGSSATQGCEKRLPRGVRKCMTWVRVSHTPPAAQARQEAAPAPLIDKIDTRDTRESTPPDGGAAPVIAHERFTEGPERGALPFPPPRLHAAGTSRPRLEERLMKRPAASLSSKQANIDDSRSSSVGTATAPTARIDKESFIQLQTVGTPPDSPSFARSGKKTTGKHPAGVSQATARTTAEQDARRAALSAVWLANPATVQPEQMSPTERRRFYSGIAKLAQSSLTPEELPALLDAQARWSRGTYTPDPHTMEASLGTLRREAVAWNKQGTALQKGPTHVGPYASPRGSANGGHPAGLAGTGGANHAGDAAILAAVQRVRARAQQEAAAGAEPGHDPPG